MIKYAVITAGLALAVVQVQVQAQVYKCSVGGKSVYSDSRCDADAKSVQGVTSNPSASSESGPVATGKQTCKIGAPASMTFNDPASVLVGQVTGGKMEVIDHADKKISARVYHVPVNAKNSYGGYVGEKSIICHTSDDGRRILKLDKTLMN